MFINYLIISCCMEYVWQDIWWLSLLLVLLYPLHDKQLICNVFCSHGEYTHSILIDLQHLIVQRVYFPVEDCCPVTEKHLIQLRIAGRCTLSPVSTTLVACLSI